MRIRFVLIFNMRFRLHKLLTAAVGTQQLERIDRAENWLDDDLRLAYLKADLKFTRANDRILLNGTIDAAPEVQCVRSLELFDLPLTVELEDAAFALPGQYVNDGGEPLPRMRDDCYVDVSEIIREAIITAIPINPVHPQFDKDTSQLDQLIGEADREWLNVKWADHNS